MMGSAPAGPGMTPPSDPKWRRKVEGLPGWGHELLRAGVKIKAAGIFGRKAFDDLSGLGNRNISRSRDWGLRQARLECLRQRGAVEVLADEDEGVLARVLAPLAVELRVEQHVHALEDEALG